MSGCNAPPGSVLRVANQPATPNRVVRIPDELWDEARVIADERGETMSEYVRRLIREDVRRWPVRLDPGC